MADIIATRRVLRAARDQMATARAHLRLLSVKVSQTLLTLQRAKAAYRDSLRFIGAMEGGTRFDGADPADKG
jgi:hypothetical protein